MAPMPSADACQWCSPESMIDGAAAAGVGARRDGPAGQVERGGGGFLDPDMRLPPWGRWVGLGTGPPPALRRSPARREVALVAAPQLGARLPDRVLERVGEGRRRGRDDVRVAAHRRPRARAVLRVDDHARPRRRRRVAVEDAHLVVDQVDVVDGRVERAQRLAQRGVERVDRAVAVGGGVERSRRRPRP